MKITGATTTLFKGSCVLELHADRGFNGIAIGGLAARRHITSLFRQFLLGEDPRAAPALWQRMTAVSCGRRDRPRAEAAALLDVALWDLKAKANREPLWKTLGGSLPRVNAVLCWQVNLGDSKSRKRFGELAREFAFRQVMMRPGPNADVDRRQFNMAHRALACRHGELALDAAGTWSPTQLIRRVRLLERRFDLAWVALAATDRNAPDLRKVSDSVRAAVCAGRGLRFPADFGPHFRRRSVDLIQIDINVNGITGAMQLADAAFALELPVMLCAAPGNVHVHLAGAMPYVLNAEVTAPRLPPDTPYRSDVRIEDGYAVAGDAAGNGIAINRAALVRARVGPLPAIEPATRRRKK
jgi:L-alanine-DL-glutamate epimerase-like enolase superfamily enzyme